jgi:hypothetical protein
MTWVQGQVFGRASFAIGIDQFAINSELADDSERSLGVGGFAESTNAVVFML